MPQTLRLDDFRLCLQILAHSFMSCLIFLDFLFPDLLDGSSGALWKPSRLWPSGPSPRETTEPYSLHLNSEWSGRGTLLLQWADRKQRSWAKDFRCRICSKNKQKNEEGAHSCYLVTLSFATELSDRVTPMKSGCKTDGLKKYTSCFPSYAKEGNPLGFQGRNCDWQLPIFCKFLRVKMLYNKEL